MIIFRGPKGWRNSEFDDLEELINLAEVADEQHRTRLTLPNYKMRAPLATA